MSSKETYIDSKGNTWYVTTLREKSASLKPFNKPLKELEHWLDSSVWETHPITIREAANHFERIYTAKLTQPIILSSSGELMDGAHRLALAYHLGLEYIKAVQFSINPEPDILTHAKKHINPSTETTQKQSSSYERPYNWYNTNQWEERIDRDGFPDGHYISKKRSDPWDFV